MPAIYPGASGRVSCAVARHGVPQPKETPQPTSSAAPGHHSNNRYARCRHPPSISRRNRPPVVYIFRPGRIAGMAAFWLIQLNLVYLSYHNLILARQDSPPGGPFYCLAVYVDSLGFRRTFCCSQRSRLGQPDSSHARSSSAIHNVRRPIRTGLGVLPAECCERNVLRATPSSAAACLASSVQG